MVLLLWERARVLIHCKFCDIITDRKEVMKRKKVISEPLIKKEELIALLSDLGNDLRRAQKLDEKVYKTLTTSLHNAGLAIGIHSPWYCIPFPFLACNVRVSPSEIKGKVELHYDSWSWENVEGIPIPKVKVIGYRLDSLPEEGFMHVCEHCCSPGLIYTCFPTAITPEDAVKILLDDGGRNACQRITQASMMVSGVLNSQLVLSEALNCP